MLLKEVIKLSFKVKGLEQTRKKLSIQIKKEINTSKAALLNSLVVKLKDNTPVDTGFARDNWRVDESGNIVNDAPYIDRLNRGSSKQAPAYFVEATLLSDSNVSSNGTIVRYK